MDTTQSITTNNATLREDSNVEFKDTKYKHLRVAQGGKEPPGTEGNVWLLKYDVGTVFTARKHPEDYILILFAIVDKPTPISYTLVGKNIGEIDVDPVQFSQAWHLFEIRQTAEETKLKQEALSKETEDDGDGSVRPGDVDHDGDAQA